MTRPAFILSIFLLIGGGIYLNALDNPFQYDDDHVIVKNLPIRDIKNLPAFFVNPHLSATDPKIAGHYRPFVTASYAIDYALGGLSPVGYHLVNLGFHIGSAFLIFLIVQAMLGGSEHVAGSGRHSHPIPPHLIEKLGGGKKGGGGSPAVFLASLSSGLIFLVHPFNSEAVNYLTARSSVMSGFFYLLAFYCWVKFRSKEQETRNKKPEGTSALTSRLLPLASCFYIFSLLAFVAGMLSKEVLITLPIVLWLYDFYFTAYRGRRLKHAATSFFNWRTYLPYIPFVLLVVVPYLLIRLFSFGKVVGPFQRGIVTQVLTEVPVLLKHWRMFLFPKGLSMIHDVEIYHRMAGPVFLSGVLLLLYVGVALYLLSLKEPRWRTASFFMFWFFVVLLPTTILPLNAIFQENRGYLAIVSFAVLTGIVLGEIDRKGLRRLFWAATLILLSVYSVLSIQRNLVWGDDVRLWKDSVEKAPNSAIAYAGLSGVYRDRGNLRLSLQTARKGAFIDPEDYHIRINLGRTYQLMGDIPHAIQEYEKALSIAPDQAIILNDLAILYGKAGDLERAETTLRRASMAWGNQPHIHYNLGILLSGRGKMEEAVEEFKEAISLNPSYLEARYELGETLERIGRTGEAEDQYREIIRTGSGGYDAWSSIMGQDKGMKRKIVESARQRLLHNAGNRQ